MLNLRALASFGVILIFHFFLFARGVSAADDVATSWNDDMLGDIHAFFTAGNHKFEEPKTQALAAVVLAMTKCNKDWPKALFSYQESAEHPESPWVQRSFDPVNSLEIVSRHLTLDWVRKIFEETHDLREAWEASDAPKDKEYSTDWLSESDGLGSNNDILWAVHFLMESVLKRKVKRMRSNGPVSELRTILDKSNSSPMVWVNKADSKVNSFAVMNPGPYDPNAPPSVPTPELRSYLNPYNNTPVPGVDSTGLGMLVYLADINEEFGTANEPNWYDRPVPP